MIVVHILLFLVWLGILISMIVTGMNWILLVVFIIISIYFLCRIGNGALLEVIGDIFDAFD